MEPRFFVIEVEESIEESVVLKGLEVAVAAACCRYRCCSTDR
jgi:hypothetical protein